MLAAGGKAHRVCDAVLIVEDEVPQLGSVLHMLEGNSGLCRQGTRRCQAVGVLAPLPQSSVWPACPQAVCICPAK